MNGSGEDWRRMGQEAFLAPGTRLIRKQYVARSDTWEHDHCAFCFAKFVDPSVPSSGTQEEVRTEGYTTTAEFERGTDYESVCSNCLADFAEEFAWVVEDPDQAGT